MKKRGKLKLLKLTLILSFILSIFNVSILAHATEPQPTSTTLTTKVTIHKLQADYYNQSTGILNENGNPIDINQLGKNVKVLGGVTFTAYGISKEEFENYSKTSNNIPKEPPVDKTITPIGTTSEETGTVEWKVDVDRATNGQITPKYFLVYETKAPSNVSSSIAVPFVIAFPMTDTSGTNYLSEVNIYPKNVTGGVPVIDKDVTKLKNDESSYNIGETVPFILKSNIPTNIQDYKEINFIDELNEAFTYKEGVEVFVGDKKLDPKDFSVATEIDKVTVTITPEGIKTITNLVPYEKRGNVTSQNIATMEQNTQDNPFIEVHLNATLNNKAPMNTKISNSFKLTYINGTVNEGVQELKDTSNSVNVITGGKIFNKVDNEGGKLSDAQFTLYEGEEIVKWNDELIAANKENIDLFVNQKTDEAIILKSSTEKDMIIKGLAYSALGKDGIIPTTYSLKETKAPEGYQKLFDPVNFTVDDKSMDDLLSITNMKRPVIPATGGIGTIIFLVIGAILMGIAIRGYNKQKEEA